MNVARVALPEVPGIIDKKGQSSKAAKADFGQFLANALEKVNSQLNYADKLSEAYAAGKNVELHNVIIAGEQASLALYLTVQVRNKVIEAYQEISRMQV
jgi:flagellar hook-basal body complex protein FliE